MSVLVTSMKMPETCLECPMQFGGMCYVQPSWVDECRVAPTVEEAWKQKKPEWCPLIDVKETYMSIVDDDALALKAVRREIDEYLDANEFGSEYREDVANIIGKYIEEGAE